MGATLGRAGDSRTGSWPPCGRRSGLGTGQDAAAAVEDGVADGVDVVEVLEPVDAGVDADPDALELFESFESFEPFDEDVDEDLAASRLSLR
ncbi:MAG TPA: hypothetical protein VKQ07_06905 [Jatrophihabitantaceae bacterium]|nr:hypothetical protein [Jatrophihabitantaceae bacterium]